MLGSTLIPFGLYLIFFLWLNEAISPLPDILSFYSVFPETGATQTMKTNQMAELRQQIPTFSNPANQMSSSKLQ